MTADWSRYARQIVLREVGVNGQAVLRDSTALIVGLGGLGTPAAHYLAAAGLGRLILSDRDRIERSNLQRQILYRGADVGRAKLEAAVEALQAINPDCAIDARPGPFDETALRTAVREADVVLDCTDNFPARFAINRACVVARRPLVSGAAIRFEGQLALFDTAAGSACYACLYGEHGEAQETCEEAGILGPVVGVIGSAQALLAIKQLLRLGDEAGILQLWDALKGEWKRLRVPRDPQCRVCGRPPSE